MRLSIGFAGGWVPGRAAPWPDARERLADGKVDTVGAQGGQGGSSHAVGLADSRGAMACQDGLGKSHRPVLTHRAPYSALSAWALLRVRQGREPLREASLRP